MAYTPVISIPEDANYGYQPHTGYGYGFFIQQPADGSEAVVYHTGDNGGFTIYAGKIPRRDITVMLFSTRNDIDRMGMVNAILALLKKN
jgi:CubicO group peptidase (beta-lactamase class C family)